MRNAWHMAHGAARRPRSVRSTPIPLRASSLTPSHCQRRSYRAPTRELHGGVHGFRKPASAYESPENRPTAKSGYTVATDRKIENTTSTAMRPPKRSQLPRFSRGPTTTLSLHTGSRNA